jgi:hypothetical protein
MAAVDNLSGAQFDSTPDAGQPSVSSPLPDSPVDPENADVATQTPGQLNGGSGTSGTSSPKLKKLPAVDHRASTYAPSIYRAIRPGA